MLRKKLLRILRDNREITQKYEVILGYLFGEFEIK